MGDGSWIRPDEWWLELYEHHLVLHSRITAFGQCLDKQLKPPYKLDEAETANALLELNETLGSEYWVGWLERQPSETYYEAVERIVGDPPTTPEGRIADPTIKAIASLAMNLDETNDMVEVCLKLVSQNGQIGNLGYFGIRHFESFRYGTKADLPHAQIIEAGFIQFLHFLRSMKPVHDYITQSAPECLKAIIGRPDQVAEPIETRPATTKPSKKHRWKRETAEPVLIAAMIGNKNLGIRDFSQKTGISTGLIAKTRAWKEYNAAKSTGIEITRDVFEITPEIAVDHGMSPEEAAQQREESIEAVIKNQQRDKFLDSASIPQKGV